MLGNYSYALGYVRKRLGHNLKAEQTFRRSLEVFEKLAADFPDFAPSKYKLPVYHDRLVDRLKALKNTKEAEQMCLDSIAFYEHLRGRIPERHREYRTRQADIYQCLAAHLGASDRHKEACKAYGQAIEIYEQSAMEIPVGTDDQQKFATACNALAWLLGTCPDLTLRDADRALELAQRAVELTPQVGLMWNTLGVAHYRAQDWLQAIKSLERSEELDPGKHFGLNGFFLAMAESQLSHQVEARKWYDQATQWMEKNQPQNEELRRFRAEAEKLLKIDQQPTTQAK